MPKNGHDSNWLLEQCLLPLFTFWLKTIQQVLMPSSLRALTSDFPHPPSQVKIFKPSSHLG